MLTRAACSIIFCEAVAIYGVIGSLAVSCWLPALGPVLMQAVSVAVAIILQTKIVHVLPLDNGFYPLAAITSGYAILAAGLTTGWANLACG